MSSPNTNALTAAVFYVYEHYRPDTDACFYVGKGHGRRSLDMKNGRNRHHKFIQSKLHNAGLAVEVRVVSDNMAEEAAFALEIERIAYWRKAGIKICNVANGGKGTAGVPVSPEALERLRRLAASRRGIKRDPSIGAKVSASKRGHVVTAETREKLRAAFLGRKHPPRSPESIERYRQAKLGHTVSAETRAKISATKRLRFASK